MDIIEAKQDSKAINRHFPYLLLVYLLAPQVNVFAGAQNIQMDHSVIIAANTVSQHLHVNVHATIHVYYTG